MADDVSEYFTVTIEKVASPRYNLCGTGKLHFEVTSHEQSSNDPNNNNTSVTTTSEKDGPALSKNLTCFELLEQGVRCIKVAPTVDQVFSIECTKSNGSAEKTVSVQVIHQRTGVLRDSNENFTIVPRHQGKNLTAENRPKILSTFQAGKRNTFENSTSITSLSDVSITEDDLRRFSRFTFKFTPILERKITVVQEEPPPPTPVEDNLNENFEERGASESEGSGNVKDTDEFDEESAYDCITEMEQEEMESSGQENATIQLQTVLENLISITIELKNLFHPQIKQFTMPNGDKTQSSLNDFYFPYNVTTTTYNSKPNCRDFQEIARAQAIFQQQNSLQNRGHLQFCKNSNKVYLLRKFIKVNVKFRLQSLGVQQLDCNEIIEQWEAKQNSPFFQFPEDEEYDKSVRSNQPTGIISPFISKPNSALFQLGPSGHITKSIFSTFVAQVETLKGIMHNATCNLIHISVCLLLPEIKLLWGRQLQTNRNPVFIHEWTRLILLSASELHPVAPEEVVVMVNRELKTLKSLSKQLHKSIKKVFGKIEGLSKFSETIFRRTLAHLNPKSLRKLDAFDVALRKKYSPSYIHYDSQQLQKLKIEPADLFRDHIFFSETDKGELLIKTDVTGFWERFTDLDFVERRAVFLALTEDLQTNLRTCLNTTEHIQEIYTAGYPGSIKHLLKDVVEELKFTAKRGDLTLLIKTSIVTHVTCLHEMLTRLLYISQEVKGITKQFNANLQPLSFDVKKLSRQHKKGAENKGQFSDTDTTTFNAMHPYHRDSSSPGIGNASPQLAIPFNNPGINLTFKNQSI